MSNALIEKIQAMSQAKPSLSERINDALVQIIGEPVQFYTVILTESDDKKMLVTTAGMLEQEHMKTAPIYVLKALAAEAGIKVPGLEKHFSNKNIQFASTKKH